MLNYVEELYVVSTIHTPDSYVAAIMKFCSARSGEFMDMHYLDGGAVRLTWAIPLNDGFRLF